MSQEENKDKQSGLRMPLGRTDFGNVQIPANLMPQGYLPHPTNTSQITQLKYGSAQRPNFV